MKTISNLLAILFFAFAVSCKNEPSDKNADVEQNPMNEELTKTTNYEESGNFKDEEYILDANKDSLNVNWDLDNPERQQNLYKTFSMTEIQIQQYEKALEDWWKSDDDSPYDKLSANERIKKEDEILKDILNDSQYKKYREWANENDKRGI
ncbi:MULTISPECIES: hypothetical protein [Bizionia]|uniref:Uncharacterized protein n=1 Tax=Bizionia algoritergicola TaxID=291187 RepID=A0A5D0QQC3_9FLAO|nr:MULTISPECIES: hypothetical protein [Bizionia]OBX22333.1 hypothetical protein BAA08_08715 [Bizionia sp. APA-3]TYB70548.1 hypothetical protein ES675_15365 [Bizionia algoritergicola]